MKNTTTSNILMVAYFFSIEDGVGSQRSRSLYSFLKKQGFSVFCINKNTWKRQNQVLWGIRVACYIIKNGSHYDKIYISCGPFKSLLFISLGARIADKAFVVDFRDPWSLNIATNYGVNNVTLSLKQRIRLCISRTVEKFTYKTCQHFIVCTEGMERDYGRLFQDSKKLRLITNGYDFYPEVFSNISSQTHEIRFVCIGKFAEYNKQKAAQILSAIKQYGILKKHRIRLIFIGSDRDQNEPLVSKAELYADWYPLLPYQQALSIAANAHFGLCLVRNEKYEYGTKVFDYIGLGLPIFDYFEEDNNFRSYFRAYLSTEIGRIPIEDRLHLSREQVFRRNMDVFE